MIMLKNYNIKENMKFIFILILLTWICYLKSDKRIFGRSLENEYKVQRTSFASFNRLLAKHVFQEELKSHRPRELLSDNIMNKNMKNVFENTSNYGELNKRIKNDLESYKKGYKRRYSKKNILGKFECYCEKKVFDKIDDINKLSEKIHNDKKRLIKEILKKHCRGIIILSLILLLNRTIYILFTGDNALIPWCKQMHPKHDISKCEIRGIIHADQDIFNAVHITNFVLFLLLFIILISVVIYSLIKIVKYERLKKGRGKMNTTGYINFCKEVFN